MRSHLNHNYKMAGNITLFSTTSATWSMGDLSASVTRKLKRDWRRGLGLVLADPGEWDLDHWLDRNNMEEEEVRTSIRLERGEKGIEVEKTVIGYASPEYR